MVAIYLYCLARPGASVSVVSTGVDGECPVNLIPYNNLLAVISEVRVEEFVGPEAEARMRDLAWVGPRACRHEEVIEQLIRSSPVLPAGFATLFSSREKLERWLEDHYEALSGALDRFVDHEEWAVKGALDRRKAEARLLATTLAGEGGLLSSSPGARYLEERRIQAESCQEIDAWLKEVSAKIANALLEHAAEFRIRDVVSGQAPDEEGVSILNWAFLVHRHHLDDFREQLRWVNAQQFNYGLVLTLSGPWPPYSFCPPLEREA